MKTKIAKSKDTKRALAGDTIPRAKLAGVAQHLTKKMSREQVAKIVDDAASQVSRLMNGHLAEISADRTARWLTRLGCNIDITVYAPDPVLRKRQRGRVHFQYTEIGK